MKLNYEHKELFEQLMTLALAAINPEEDCYSALDEFELWVHEAYENYEGELNLDITKAMVEKRLNDILEVINSTL